MRAKQHVHPDQLGQPPPKQIDSFIGDHCVRCLCEVFVVHIKRMFFDYVISFDFANDSNAIGSFRAGRRMWMSFF